MPDVPRTLEEVYFKQTIEGMGDLLRQIKELATEIAKKDDLREERLVQELARFHSEVSAMTNAIISRLDALYTTNAKELRQLVPEIRNRIIELAVQQAMLASREIVIYQLDHAIKDLSGIIERISNIQKDLTRERGQGKKDVNAQRLKERIENGLVMFIMLVVWDVFQRYV